MEAIQHINPQAIDENNVDEFIQMLHAREYSPQDTIGLFQYLFDEDTNENCIDNRALVEEIIDNIDFTWFSIGDFTYEQRSKLYCAFAEKYSLGDSLAAMEFSREIGCFIPEVERKISQDDNVTSQYSQLICELDELSDVAQSWLAKNYLIAPLSVRLCEVLFKLEYYADYIIANILRDRKMVMDPRIPFAAYLEVYEKVEEVFDIMADHWDFLEQLQQEANLHELQEDRLLPVFKVRQTERFFSFIISEKTSINLKKTYLEEFGKFREEKDSIAFQKLICKPENIKLVDSIELKERISQQLWETNRAHKGQFTRKWNECWKDKLTQAQPV